MTVNGIAEQARKMRIEVEQLPSLRQAANNGQAVATRADQLEKLASELKSQTARLQLFRDQGIDPFVSHDRIASLLSTTRSYRTRFEEDPSSISADPEDSGMKWKYREELRILNRSIERSLDQSWQEFVDLLIPPGLNEQLIVLAQARVLAKDVARMRELEEHLIEARSHRPNNAGDFASVQVMASELKCLWQSLTEIPEEVRDFLIRASTDGATLDAFSPTVHAWLEQNGLIGSVRYVLRSHQ
ncbi:MAG: hypothetical protein OXD50_05050 [Chloroflexi bacterium]|nr:hypothetical protein [Chloroflexota bacterium]